MPTIRQQGIMDGMEITRFGHAAILVETEGIRILIDPGVFSIADVFELTGLDAIIVTHQHADHLDLERFPQLFRANPDAALLCDPQTAHLSDYPWRVHQAGDETRFGPVSVQGVGGRHAVITEDLEPVANVGVVIHAPDDVRLFHPGDSYDDVPSDIDVLALPLSAPWAKIAETAEFVRDVGAAEVFYIHDCTIAERAYDIYAGHVRRFANGRVHALEQHDTLTV